MECDEPSTSLGRIRKVLTGRRPHEYYDRKDLHCVIMNALYGGKRAPKVYIVFLAWRMKVTGAIAGFSSGEDGDYWTQVRLVVCAMCYVRSQLQK